MTQQNELPNQPILFSPLGKRMLQSAGLALIVIILFLFSAGDEPSLNWPKLWIVKLLLMVLLANTLGGVFYYFMDQLHEQGSWVKVLAVTMNLIGYIVVVWLGTFLGSNGAMWN